MHSSSRRKHVWCGAAIGHGVHQQLCTHGRQGIIRRVQEDGPNGGNIDLDVLPRSVRYRLRDLMDDVRARAAPAQSLSKLDGGQ
jgi:hypothetical protein